MTNADREQLRRIAYGPDATSQERAAAEESLRQLDEQRHLAASAVAEDSAVAPDQLGDVDDDIADLLGSDFFSVENAEQKNAEQESTEPSLWQRRIRVGWLIPIAVGAVLVGAAGAWGFTGQTDRDVQAETVEPSPGETISLAVPITSGRLTAADAWFDTPYANSDAFPDPSQLEYYDIGAEDVRLALSSGGMGRVWVGRTEGKLCLLIASEAESSTAATCTERERFRDNGVGLYVNGFSAQWSGSDVITNPPIRSAPHVQKPGPGDIAAANSWFESPATPADVYPISGVLDQMGVDQSRVRVVGADGGSNKFWIAQQGTQGFCLASYDRSVDRAEGQGRGLWKCVTMSEFEASGITLAADNFAAAWNGAVFTVAG